MATIARKEHVYTGTARRDAVYLTFYLKRFVKYRTNWFRSVFIQSRVSGLRYLVSGICWRSLATRGSLSKYVVLRDILLAPHEVDNVAQSRYILWHIDCTRSAAEKKWNTAIITRIIPPDRQEITRLHSIAFLHLMRGSWKIIRFIPRRLVSNRIK